MSKIISAIAGLALVSACCSISVAASAGVITDSQIGAKADPTDAPKKAKKPIAYGYINTSGNVESGSGNFTASYASGTYTITITGLNYFFESYSTVVTPSEPNPSLCTTDSVSGNLLVQCYTLNGAPTTADFAFIVF